MTTTLKSLERKTINKDIIVKNVIKHSLSAIKENQLPDRSSGLKNGL